MKSFFVFLDNGFLAPAMTWFSSETELYLFCREVLPDGRYVGLNTEKISRNLDIPFDFIESDVITCKTDYEGYLRLSYFSLGRDNKIYEMQRIYDDDYGLYFTPIYPEY